MKVNQLMTKNIICVSPFSTAAEASQIMIKKRVRRLLVVQNNILIGVLTHNDLPQSINSQLTVKDIMTINPVSIIENAEIQDAIRIMKQLNIGGLPVVNNLGHAIGIITSFDINNNQKKIK